MLPASIANRFKANKISRKFLLQNLWACATICLIFLAIDYLGNGNISGSQGLFILSATAVLFLVFYLNFFCCVLFLEHRKLLFFSAVLILYFLFLLLCYRIAFGTYLTNATAQTYSSRSAYVFVQIYIASIYYVITFVIALAYWAIRNSAIRKAENLKKEKKLIASNIALQEKEETLRTQLLLSENNFLRAQINPHFLYNSLNLIYSHTRSVLPEVANAIMMLSQIMRYSITDFSARGGMADLDSETEHLKNVITLNKFRYDNKIEFELICEGNFADKLIAPMILVTLVENIFKHGNLQDHKATVIARVDEHTEQLFFSTIN